MKIIFLTPYPHGQAPSQRFRFEQYLDILRAAGHEVETRPFLDRRTWEVLYQPGHSAEKLTGVIKGFFRRFLLLFSLSKFDFVFIHREAAPLGPPFFEFIIAKVLGKKVIYDFDDAIWLQNTSDNNRIASAVKFHGKAATICKYAYKVSAGNAYLQSFALQYNANSLVIPTTIDTTQLHNPALFATPAPAPLTIGWTGSHSTMKYLDFLYPILTALRQRYEFRFLVISNESPQDQPDYVEFLKWKKETEMEDLLQFDIGVMPLTDDIWAQGKCGFKALQYMALGIPPVISPVGVNTEIVTHGVNGMLAETEAEWTDALETLINDGAEREKLGKAARRQIIENYSVLAVKEQFLGLFS